MASNFLRVDITGFGGIRLTEGCGPVLKGQTLVFFRKEAKPEPRARRRPTTTLAAFEESVHAARPDDKPLFDALRRLRLDLARDQGVPPYVVFGDTTLAAMVRHRPTTLDAFARLSGVGQVKLERYGEAFIEVIRAFDA